MADIMRSMANVFPRGDCIVSGRGIVYGDIFCVSSSVIYFLMRSVGSVSLGWVICFIRLGDIPCWVSRSWVC